MAIIVPLPDQRTTAVDLTRTRDANGGSTAKATVPTPSDTTFGSIPTVRERGAIPIASSSSIAISGELGSPTVAQSAVLPVASDPPPEPIEPPLTPAAFAPAGARPPATLKSRILNPRFVAIAASVAGIAIVGVAISVASRSSSPAPSSKPPIPAITLEPAASRPEPGPTTAAIQAPAAALPPAAAVDARGPAPSLPDTALPDVGAKSVERPADGKRRRHARPIPRDENGFPIIK